jgi:hypothetical protein
MEAEGLDIVRGVRERYNGAQRNPWCEYECGAYYARAMSSWSLLTAHLPFYYNAAQQSLRLYLRTLSGTGFWSCGSGWGTLQWNDAQCVLTVSYGSLSLREISGTGPGWTQAQHIVCQSVKLISAGESQKLAALAD